MAVATTTLLAISAVAAAAGTAYSMYAADTAANQQEANLKFQSAQDAADAAAARGEAEVEAMRIRKAGRAQKAQAVAAAAASGIDVNSPTALRIDEEITKNSEEDARLTILQGSDRGARLNQQSHANRTGAAIAKDNGRMESTASLISGASSAAGSYSNWKKAKGT